MLLVLLTSSPECHLGLLQWAYQLGANQSCWRMASSQSCGWMAWSNLFSKVSHLGCREVETSVAWLNFRMPKIQKLNHMENPEWSSSGLIGITPINFGVTPPLYFQSFMHQGHLSFSFVPFFSKCSSTCCLVGFFLKWSTVVSARHFYCWCSHLAVRRFVSTESCSPKASCSSFLDGMWSSLEHGNCPNKSTLSLTVFFIFDTSYATTMWPHFSKMCFTPL